MADGIATPNLPLVTSLDEVLGNYNGDTARMLRQNLVALVASQVSIAVGAGAGIYPTMAAGNAATTDGNYFFVAPGTSNPAVALILYRRLSGTAVEQSRIAAAA